MKKHIIILSLACSLLAVSCLNDEFLELYPKDQQTEATVFTTYDNFKTYAWGLYNVFFGYSYGTGQSMEIFRGDYEADNMIYHEEGSQSQWAYQTAKASSTSSHWEYDYIRQVNVMLDNIDGSEMSDNEKAHWRSVGYFFRSYKYFQMLSKFGDIPWVEHVLNDESEELYDPRETRDVVAKNILDNLNYAIENIGSFDDGSNTINVYVIQALLSRFALFEGTWRKYHSPQDGYDTFTASDYTTYLEACVTASEAVMNAYPTLHSAYDELFNSEDLAGVDGVLLYKVYETSQLMHGMTRLVRTGESRIDATKSAVDCYLCQNGYPVENPNSGYEGDKDVYDQFRSRDHRLYLTVCPPYYVNAQNSSSDWSFWEGEGTEKYREYIDYMANITGETYHRLPHFNFRDYVGWEQPHFYPVASNAWGRSYLGFWVWKYYNTHTDCSNANGTCTTDAPLFRTEEAMLDYAEAMFELGRFSQSVADMTINKLRARANVADMNVSAIDADFDPARDSDVDPVLWEIRRERRVEFMGEGFRLDDLRRWSKCHYLDTQQIGVYMGEEVAAANSMLNYMTDDGYAFFHGVPAGYLDYYYLYPLPLTQLVLNPNLKQNPGWTSAE